MFMRVFVKVFLAAWMLFALASVAYGLSGTGQMDGAHSPAETPLLREPT
jgi:hypothetical protein